MIHTAFQRIVIAFSSHFNTQSTNHIRINLNTKLDMFSCFAFQRLFQSNQLCFLKRFSSYNLCRNNTIFLVIAMMIIFQAIKYAAKFVSFAEKFHEIKHIRMNLSRKSLIQQRKTFRLCNGLIPD